MTFEQHFQRILGGQSKNRREIERLKTGEKSSSTDDIIRKRYDENGDPYVEIGTGLTSRANLVPNGGFECDLTGWVVEYSNGINPIASVSSEDVYSGVGALKLNVSDSTFTYGKDVQLTNTIGALPNTTYAFSAYVKNNGHDFADSPVIVYQILSDGGIAPLVSLIPDIIHPDWVHYSNTGTTNSNCVELQIIVFVSSDGAFVAPVYFDDITVEMVGSDDPSIRADADSVDLLKDTNVSGNVSASNITATPTASTIPKADESGKLDEGWLPDLSGTYLGVGAKAADSDRLDGVDSTGFVNTTAAQTVAGIKTFSSIPVLPASNPTTDNQAARKAYVDGRVVFLTTPLTSTSWDGDNKTTSDRAIVDLSAVFGVPAGVKAVLMSVQTQGDTANDYIRFGPDSTYNYALTCRTQVAGQIMNAYGVVPCNSDGDVYCYPSGTVEGVWVWIWGYWL